MLYRDGVFVNVVCPGWVRTPMTDLEERRVPPHCCRANAAAESLLLPSDFGQAYASGTP